MTKRNGTVLGQGGAAAALTQAQAAAEAEAQRVAHATERSVTTLLGRLADDMAPGQEEAILTGAIYALVRFTFARCWSPLRPRLSAELLRRWAPMMISGCVAAVRQPDEPK